MADFGEGTPLSADEVARVQRLLSDPLALPATFKNWLVAYLRNELRGLPLSAIAGAAGLAPNFGGPVLAREQRVSSTYGDLTTFGPEITGLPPGQYIVLHGCVCFIEPTDQVAYQSVSLNGDTPSDDNAVVSYRDLASTNGIMGFLPTLQEDSNTLTVKYRSFSGVGAWFERRWILAIRYAAL